MYASLFWSMLYCATSKVWQADYRERRNFDDPEGPVQVADDVLAELVGILAASLDYAFEQSCLAYMILISGAPYEVQD